MGDNIKVLYLDMPTGCRAFTIENDDYYTIYVNSRYSREQNAESLEHELSHIKNGDFERFDVNDIELKTHGFRKGRYDAFT